MPKYNEEQLKPLLAISPKDKITAGIAKKVRAAQYELANTDRDMAIFYSSVAFMCERQLDRKAANRPTFSKVVSNSNKTDQEMAASIPGCIGFETITA